MNDLMLNLVENIPNQEWTSIYEDAITGPLSISNNSEISKYINLFKENGIQYLSYFSDNISGGKHPKYTNKLSVFIKTDEFEYIQTLLFEKGILLNKTMDEIEEFKEIGTSEDLTYEDLSRTNKFFHFVALIIGLLFLLGATVLLAYLSTKVVDGKIASIIVTVLFGLITLLYIKRLFLSNK